MARDFFSPKGVEYAPKGRRVSSDAIAATISGADTRLELNTPNATPLMVAPKLFIDLVTKARIQALERERHQIVNNFAVSASAGYELTPLSP